MLPIDDTAAVGDDPDWHRFSWVFVVHPLLEAKREPPAVPVDVVCDAKPREQVSAIAGTATTTTRWMMMTMLMGEICRS